MYRISFTGTEMRLVPSVIHIVSENGCFTAAWVGMVGMVEMVGVTESSVRKNLLRDKYKMDMEQTIASVIRYSFNP